MAVKITPGNKDDRKGLLEMVKKLKEKCCAARALKAQGAQDIYAYVTHGVLSPGALQRLEKSPLKELVLTNSIQAPQEALACPFIRYINIALLLEHRP